MIEGKCSYEGIIPARAGFTGRPCGPGRAGPDHPRSRGVYGVACARVRASGGSSPLARGLLRQGLGEEVALGIIPARAGFTMRSAACGPRTRDHPRSRGVYDLRLRIADIAPGSSPLARGLPPRSPRSGASVTDHPRSRGVYAALSDEERMALGSSPLARGLLDGPLPGPEGGRIIPARAGFTGWDRAVRMTPAGSSPLARGLRSDALLLVARLGIIPARAGFTRHRRIHGVDREDHPRSRGVYWTST